MASDKNVKVQADGSGGIEVVHLAGDETICGGLSSESEIRVTGTLEGSKSPAVTVAGVDAALVLGGVTASTNWNIPMVLIASAKTSAGDPVGGNVKVTLTGVNTLSTNSASSALHVGSRSTLTLDGSGKLKASNKSGAGIGGSRDAKIIIAGGEIDAESSGLGGAGIGGSSSYLPGDVTITGGTITARGSMGAGIGGGGSGGGGKVTITGGTITAISKNGAGIGGGFTNGKAEVAITGGTVAASGRVDIGGLGGNSDKSTVSVCGGSVQATDIGAPEVTCSGTVVNMNELTVGDPYVPSMPLTGGRLDGESMSASQVDPEDLNTEWVYGLHDVVTNKSGKVWFWLPASKPSGEVTVTTKDRLFTNRFSRPATETLYEVFGMTMTSSPDPWWMWQDETPGDHIATMQASPLGGKPVTVSFDWAGDWLEVTPTLDQPVEVGPNNPQQFTLTPHSGLQPGTYTATLTATGNSVLTTQHDATLDVIAPADTPVINGPTGANVTVGTPVSLDATATGSDTLTYQWQRASGAQGPWADVPNTTKDSYTPDTDAAGDAWYRLLVTNTKTYRDSTSTKQAYSQAVLVTVTAPEPSPSPTPDKDHTLPFTGASVLPLVLIACGAAASGLVLRLARRRLT